MKRFCIAALFSLAAIAAATTTPAHAQRLATPTPSPVGKTSAKKAEPLTGFQDIKWGDSIAKATKILEAKGASVEKADGSDNTLQVANLRVAGYSTRVMLRFGNEGFYQANVEFFAPPRVEYANQYNELQKIITERFGDAVTIRSVGDLGYANLVEWHFYLPSKETASLKLTANQSLQPYLEYRATERAEREEARVRAERAKSL